MVQFINVCLGECEHAVDVKKKVQSHGCRCCRRVTWLLGLSYQTIFKVFFFFFILELFCRGNNEMCIVF